VTRLRLALATLVAFVGLSAATLFPTPAHAVVYGHCWKWPYYGEATGLSINEAFTKAGRIVLNYYYGGSVNPWSIVQYWADGDSYIVVMRRWTGPSGYQSASLRCDT